ncbi:type II toxin-antitoxin system RelE/ParE family toxin [Ciceribacter sp. L1K23]|uniref:type II toxin-antitoxin system RelE/ParE family toxin n=1 Tax=Ciceribacter sp. L1K23 TaxID=2820276 RepID=UPI001B817571|nr:type II toxin-antitoxin system RelE/ParE family toxin [Ciceribacter sp. L1K23]MBR0555357.1 type II toxin-antitoxin system RelE/ParE family toxin [Ciceribacter sp. L1K23]
MTLILRPLAKLDIQLAAQYIADRNPDAARAWRRTILATARRLAEMPGMGHLVEGRADGVRMFCKDGYLIFYRVLFGDIEILRVIHGARDWGRLFR